jgi:hypothetical protein
MPEWEVGLGIPASGLFEASSDFVRVGEWRLASGQRQFPAIRQIATIRRPQGRLFHAKPVSRTRQRKSVAAF